MAYLMKLPIMLLLGASTISAAPLVGTEELKRRDIYVDQALDQCAGFCCTHELFKTINVEYQQTIEFILFDTLFKNYCESNREFFKRDFSKRDFVNERRVSHGAVQGIQPHKLLAEPEKSGTPSDIIAHRSNNSMSKLNPSEILKRPRSELHDERDYVLKDNSYEPHYHHRRSSHKDTGYDSSTNAVNAFRS